MSNLPGRLLLRNGRLLDPCRGLDTTADVRIIGGVTAEIGSGLRPVDGELIFNLNGHWVVPSLTDLHAALRDPGHEQKETLNALAEAAVAGGYTRIVGSPNTLPVVDAPALARTLRARAAAYGKVELLPLGAATRTLDGEQLTEMMDLVTEGVVGFSDGGRSIPSAEVLRRVLEYVRQFDLPLFIRPEDISLAANTVMHEGVVSTVTGLKGVPSAAEELMVFRAIVLARLTGARIHLTQLSAATSVDLIRLAKSTGVKVTCDVSPHHLWFTDGRVRGYGTAARVSPPLREASDRQALIHGLNDGTIDVVASGHAAQSLLEKEVEFESAQPGVTSLETTFAAILSLVKRGDLDEGRALRALVCRPTEVVGLSCTGIQVGASADLTVVGIDKPWRVDVSEFRGMCRSSLFDGVQLDAQVRMTLRHGTIVYQLNEETG